LLTQVARCRVQPTELLQRIVGVLSIEALSRNANGKMLKRELRTQFSGHTYE
jgi:hypothetical protein